MSLENQIFALQNLRLDLLRIAEQLPAEFADAATLLRERARGCADWMIALSQRARRYVTVTLDEIAGAPQDTIDDAAAMWDPTVQRLSAIVDGALVPLTADEILAAWRVFDARTGRGA